MSLATQIHVNTRYTRSINVERDRGSPSIVGAYVPTARSIDLLEDVATALGRADQPRAWSLVGPYGSGKSSFALFLHELLGPPGSAKKAARKSLAAERPDLARRFARQDPWCRVVLTGSEEPLGARLLVALNEAATNFWEGKPGRKPVVVEELRRALRRRKLADSELLRLVDSLQRAVERNGAGGLLIVIDELGKFLEYEARQGQGGVYLLQQLAERAYRARKANLLFFVLLHQGFDLYARGMGEQLKNDWAKVQGRFESVSFVEAPEQTLRVVAAAFSNSLPESQQQSVAKQSTRTANTLARAKALPSGLDADAAASIFASCYPIHPISLLALPQLCHRFAQNERTLFSYLGSREPHGFQDSLASLSKFGNRVHPDQIYDYFVHNQPAVLADPLTHRRWAEVVTAVERVEDADGDRRRVQWRNPPFSHARQDHRRVEPDFPQRRPEGIQGHPSPTFSPPSRRSVTRSSPSWTHPSCSFGDSAASTACGRGPILISMSGLTRKWTNSASSIWLRPLLTAARLSLCLPADTRFAQGHFVTLRSAFSTPAHQASSQRQVPTVHESCSS